MQIQTNYKCNWKKYTDRSLSYSLSKIKFVSVLQMDMPDSFGMIEDSSDSVMMHKTAGELADLS